MQITSILFAVVLAVYASAQVPIPNRPDGYGVGGPADAHVVIDMFLDLLCPDCKATWPIVMQVVQAYGTKIHFRIHTFPLPYHTNGFVVAQGLHVVANLTNRNLESIFQFATKVFDNQQNWYNDATKTMTMPQVVESLATFAGQTGLVTKEKFATAMTYDDINYETRVSWKYACSRGASGTPTFLINGVAVSADSSWSLADWKSVIDPILASNEKSSTPVTDCPEGQKECTYAPGKTVCCTAGESCIPNVGCRCLNKNSTPVTDCPEGQKECTYAPGKTECCLAGESCIPNVGCRCFNLRNGNKCF